MEYVLFIIEWLCVIIESRQIERKAKCIDGALYGTYCYCRCMRRMIVQKPHVGGDLILDFSTIL